MKTALILCALMTAASAGSSVLVQITPEALTKRQKHSPMDSLQQPATEEATATRPAEQSLIKQSSILHDGTNWTLVPRGAVIFVPSAQKTRVDVKPVGNLLSWGDFLTRNRAWITTTETSFDQAVGNEPIPAERTHFWSKQDKVVIAVHQNGPISVNTCRQIPSLTQR
ncbi:MAG: hypothetical protein ACRDBP_06370 [Luteolibacter sp.]